MVLAASLPVANLAQSVSGTAASSAAGSSSPINLSPVSNQNTPGEELRPVANIPSVPIVTTACFPVSANQLIDDGIDIHGAVLDRSLTNAGVGNTLGNTPNLAILRPTIDVDLGKIAGFTGAILHGSLTYWFSKSDQPGSIAQLGGALDGY